MGREWGKALRMECGEMVVTASFHFPRGLLPALRSTERLQHSVLSVRKMLWRQSFCAHLEQMQSEKVNKI